MTKFSIQTIYKNPKWTGQTIARLEHLQSIIDLRRRKTIDQTSLRAGRKPENPNDQRIVINVGGLRYETYKSTLERYPNTLLGNSQRRSPFYDKIRDEYFFDRHRLCFEAILYYYQSSGRLRRPYHVPLDTFLEEITFFDLGSNALRQVRKDEDLEEAKKVILPENPFRRHLWANLEYPQYSMTAKIINMFFVILILLSAVALVVQSLPIYRGVPCNPCQNESNTTQASGNETRKSQLSSTNDTYTRRLCQPRLVPPFFIIESICVTFFIIEFVLRVISCPSYVDFIRSILNWIDLFAILPYFLNLAVIIQRDHEKMATETYRTPSILQIFCFLRIFKLYRTFQHIKSLRVLGSTIRESLPDFMILLSFLTLCGLLFGVAIFFAENSRERDTFDSIPTAIYYGIITLTAVGYGDLAPVTGLGRGLACLAAIFGVSFVSMLVSVLVGRYQRVYARKHFLEEEHSESSVLNNSLRRSNNNENFIDSSIDMAKQFRGVSDNTNDEENDEERQSNDEPAGKVRFIIGYLSDDDPESDNDIMDGSQNQIINRFAHELLHSTSNRRRSVNKSDAI